MKHRAFIRILALGLAALFVLGLVLGIVFSAAAQAGGNETRMFGAPLTGKSRGDNVYIRKAPSAENGNNILVKLRGQKGRLFTFTGEYGDFYYTVHEGGSGYVKKEDFRLSSASRESAAASPSPSPGEWRSVGSGLPAPSAAAAPTPAAAPLSTPQPTRPPAETQSRSTVESGYAAQSYAAATGGSGDVWGSIRIPGAQSYKIYCNARTKDNSDFYYNAKGYNYIFAMTPREAQVAVIMGHNLRNSGTMFHALHHVQNAWLGKAKCEKCGKSCAGNKASVFDISYNGAERWELVCFYETEKSEPASTLHYNALQTGDAGSYLARQLARAESSPKGMVLTNASAGDRLMMLITCGDRVGGDTGARLYMLLKAVS